MPQIRVLVLCLVFIAFGVVDSARPNDWPAWRGPDRTGVSAETGLLKEWPEAGLKLQWKAIDLGQGFSTPSVADNRIYLIGAKSGEEFAIALDAKDGRQLWATKIGAAGKPNQRPNYPGSRSTPTVDGDHIYVLGSDGDLACLNKGGKVVWKKHLVKDFDGDSGTWAYAESPLIDGDALVCTPGGSKATLAALNKKTGKVIWKAPVPGGQAGYASVIVAEAGGVKQYITLLGSGLVGVGAKDGKLLWNYTKIAGNTNCPTPIFHDGFVFCSAAGGRGGGCALLRLSAEGGGVSAKEEYFGKVLANHHGGVVLIGNSLFGTNNSALVCLDFKTGATKSENRSVGKGSVSAADGRLYVRGEKDGQVALVEVTAAGYKETGRLKPADRGKRPAWPHPVIADGCLYLRDDDFLLCYDIKAK